MTASAAPSVLVVIVGPQASGKSTVSAALAADLRDRGETVALVELDGIAAMALPTLPGWDVALGIFESVTGQWMRSGATCVIAEGVGSREEADRVRAQAPTRTAVLTVAVTTPLAVAFDRAQQDPSRGVSRDHPFLAQVYSSWPEELEQLSADVVIDSAALSVEHAVALVREAMAVVRGDR